MKAMSFWKWIIRAKCGVINTEIKKRETLGAEADRMERNWKKWRKNNKNGKIVVLLGMGEDGHTAGIMPHPNDKELFDNLFVNTEKWVVGYDCGDKNIYKERMTASVYFLENIVDKCFLYFRGEKKENVFNSRFDKSLNEMPIKVVDNITWEQL